MAFNSEKDSCNNAVPLSDNCCPCNAKAAPESCDSCRPILCKEQYRRSYRYCTDADGTCCKYPNSCRDPFWPEFSHPRTLSCAQLYSGGDSRCTKAAEQEACCCKE